jgi:hypothetical protein
VAREALGDQLRLAVPENVAKYVPMKPAEPVQVKSEAVYVLTVHEAATRLGISTAEMAAMVKAGTVRTLTAGWTLVIPASEIARLAGPPAE